MKRFSGYEWLLIDAANQYGHDKMVFEDRIKWATEQVECDTLGAHVDTADNKPLYIKAVMAIRKAQQGIPTGHMVGVDACCSGVQIMSVLTGCVDGARATGLIDPEVRADAYTQATKLMNEELGGGLVVSRADAKQALMTSYYGSKKQPKAIFGEDTPELNAFYAAAQKVAPGAWELLQDLLASWQPYALSHAWKLPDGYDAYVKVMTKKEARIEVDELDHATFTYEFYENEGQRNGLSNAANLTHSMDAYVLRSMHRRCNYNREVAEEAAYVITAELHQRSLGKEAFDFHGCPKTLYYKAQYERSTLADITIMRYLNEDTVKCLSVGHLKALERILDGMLAYQPFELVTIHDEFKSHANNVDHVRWQYREILAEIADSNVVDDLLSQIHGKQGTFTKLSSDLGNQIRQSNYGLT